MSWIKTISYSESTGRLRKLYDRVKGPGDNVDNIMMLHSLRPHSMEGHMAIYKNVLHHSSNVIPKWFLETLGVYVSYLNHCDYCYEHHLQGLKRLLGDDAHADSMTEAMRGGEFGQLLDQRQCAAMRYARQLTLEPASMSEAMIKDLRDSGLDDGEILEINQVCSYFNYANRTVLGLGASTAGDILGLSPGNSDDENDWSHH